MRRISLQREDLLFLQPAIFHLRHNHLNNNIRQQLLTKKITNNVIKEGKANTND